MIDRDDPCRLQPGIIQEGYQPAFTRLELFLRWIVFAIVVTALLIIWASRGN